MTRPWRPRWVCLDMTSGRPGRLREECIFPDKAAAAKAAAASAGVASSASTGQVKGNAMAASAEAPSVGDVGSGQRGAAAASASDTDDDDVIIVNVILAQSIADATMQGGSAAAGAAAASCFNPVSQAAVRHAAKDEPLLFHTASRVAAAASVAEVVGYGDLDLNGPVWAAWVGN